MSSHLIVTVESATTAAGLEHPEMKRIALGLRFMVAKRSQISVD